MAGETAMCHRCGWVVERDQAEGAWCPRCSTAAYVGPVPQPVTDGCKAPGCNTAISGLPPLPIYCSEHRLPPAPATPPPAAPGPGTGMDERDLWTTEPESLTIRQLNKAVRALREAVHEEKVRAQQAEAERDEARTHVRRLSTVISTQKEMDAKHMELCDRAEAAEASLLALRNGVRQPLADAEEQLRIFRASLGGPDAPACNKLNRAIEGVAKVRAALGADEGRGE